MSTSSIERFTKRVVEKELSPIIKNPTLLRQSVDLISRTAIQSFSNLVEKKGNELMNLDAKLLDKVISEEIEKTFNFEIGRDCVFKGIHCISKKTKEKWLKVFFKKRNAFIEIPSEMTYSDKRDVIKNALKDNGYTPLIADEIFLPIDIFCKICMLIDISQLIIADLSFTKGNIFLEAGYAAANKKLIIFLKDRAVPIISDMPAQERIDYSSAEELGRKLGKALDSLNHDENSD